MSRLSLQSCLLGWGLQLALAAAAAAQGHRIAQQPDVGQSIPREFPVDTGDLQLFAPAEVSMYDGASPHLKEGFFFTADALSWTVSAPNKTEIGLQGGQVFVASGSGTRTEVNSVTTGMLQADPTSGARFEGGWVKDYRGWVFSGTTLAGQVQTFESPDVDVVFFAPPQGPDGVSLLQGFVNRSPLDSVDDNVNLNDLFGKYFDGNLPPDGVINILDPADQLDPALYDLGDLLRLPVVFEEFQAKNITSSNSFEAMRMWRFDPTHGGSVFEVLIGARYFQMVDQFNVDARGGILGESRWDTRANNNSVGPQIGLRWLKQFGRFTLSSEGRFFAGYNFQQVRQTGSLGSRLLLNANNGAAVENRVPGVIEATPDNPPAVRTGSSVNTPAVMMASGFNNTMDAQEFSPTGELRIDGTYQATRAIALKVGWTGFFTDGMARASSMVDYKLPNMGILANQNRENLFMQGVNFGIEINR